MISALEKKDKPAKKRQDRKVRVAGLPHGISISKTSNGAGKPYFRIYLGKRFTGSKGRYKDFSSLAQAKEWLFGPEAEKERAQPGAMISLFEKAREATAELTASQIAEAAAAYRKLGELGDQATLDQAVDFYIKHSRPTGGVKTFAEVAEFYIERKRKKKKSAKHLRGLQTIADYFTEDFGKCQVSLIQQKSAEEWLDELDLEPVTVGNYIRNLRSIFREAVKQKWCVINPFENIEKPVAIDQEITCLTPAEVAKLFLHCPPELLLSLSLKIFCGLRTSELLRLDVSQIRKAEVLVYAIQAKTRKRRPVSIQPNLHSWLAECDVTEGLVWKLGQNAYHDAINRLAAEAGVTLDSNFGRKTFCSMHYAKFKNEYLTSAEMGNSPQVVFDHYRAVATKAEAKVFWSITPKNVESIAKGEEAK